MKDKRFYSFTQPERRGFATLTVLLFTIVCVLAVLPIYHKSSRSGSEFSAFADSIAIYEQKVVSDSILSPQTKHIAKKLSPFLFDPNILSVEGWIKMGFSPKQAQSLDNYRKKGGRFHKKEDLKKIFFIGEEEYTIIEPYIEININTNSYRHTLPKKRKIFIIELNTSDTIDLKELPRIGSVFAKRIVKYRNLLGGFCKKEQLLEVYGLNDEIYEAISPYIMIDTGFITKININTATLQDLKHHPYLDYYQAKAIVKYRNIGNTFVSIDDLKNITLIDDITFEKIEPYLCVQ